MGYIIEYLLKKQLTVVEQFHSHLEPMKFLNKDTFHEQVTSTPLLDSVSGKSLPTFCDQVPGSSARFDFALNPQPDDAASE